MSTESPCQPSQPKETFDRGDPTATNDYPKIAHATSVRRVERPAIGRFHGGVRENYVERRTPRGKRGANGLSEGRMGGRPGF